MKKTAYLILGGLLVLFLVLRIVSWNESRKISKELNRNSTNIVYTKHAKCRMDCRHITKDEVLDILKNGKVNIQKSDMNDKPCPTYAVEDITDDGDKLRIIFAQCNNEIKVVTAIDLKKEHNCDCQ